MLKLKVFLSVAAVLLASTSAVVAEEELFDTSTAGVHLEKGIAHLKAKELDAAVSELEEAVSIYPDAESYYYLGYAYYLKGRSGDTESRKSSIENFERAYELDPGFSPTRLTTDVEDAALGAGTKSEPQPGGSGETATTPETDGQQQTDPSAGDSDKQSPAKSVTSIDSTSPVPESR